MSQPIYFPDSFTWPKELEEIFLKYKDSVLKENHEESKIINKGFSHAELENPFTQLATHEIRNFLKENTALAWHCTRTKTPEKILIEGLKPLSIEFFNDSILPEVLAKSNERQKSKFIEILASPSFKKKYGGRFNQIWFYFDKKETTSEYSKLQYLNCFGGELLKIILTELGEEELEENLKNVGQPYVVELVINLNQVEGLEGIASIILKNFLSKSDQNLISSSQNVVGGYIKGKAIIPKGIIHLDNFLPY